ncbi:hypothetical protein CC80DRAFT_563739 [Byssothecium circinans]|uniref:Uncharacterized protein n=1 Tax=Byssothecium circinans TaxID=147558 RepID=A0A6A5TU02_9PLEO|nr:hypothetical protein CC80DRAFT_563739 [Byssothecium circinans]
MVNSKAPKAPRVQKPIFDKDSILHNPSKCMTDEQLAAADAVDYGFKNARQPAEYAGPSLPTVATLSNPRSKKDLIQLLGNSLWCLRNMLLPEVHNILEDRPYTTAEDPIAQEFANMDLPLNLEVQDLLRIVLYYDLKILPETEMNPEEEGLLVEFNGFRTFFFEKLCRLLGKQIPGRESEKDTWARIILDQVIGKESDLYKDGDLEQAQKWEFGFNEQTGQWWKEKFVKALPTPTELIDGIPNEETVEVN